MSTRRLLLLVSLATLCGCATPSSQGASPGASSGGSAAPSSGTGGSGSAASSASGSGAKVEGNIVVNAAGRATSGQLKDGTLTAPQVSVSVDPKAARGRIAGATVDLTLSDSEVVGQVGSNTTRLQFAQQGGQLMAKGMFAGSGSQLLLTPQKLEGQFLKCTYVLQRAGAAAGSATGGSGGAGGELSYEGKRNCAGSREVPATVSLPAGFTGLSPAEQVTLLNLVLAR
ncbi:hypothetical protein FGE12_11945 [Aggregicoccus sp. 17bor-14]|uniref:hypothetical protein n=1 Tax=Myxococcaceae TaxID=31 RepID=UPI00129CE73F|nr:MULTISPECIES: hypothetical protein [Myxococcaceae]MBF5043101.1 hypothetical protein [Simulacricoccus sp. 17bor-14]MRI88863.1 hypothetical protein [Aggregicoccus sp. 17bor-14]